MKGRMTTALDLRDAALRVIGRIGRWEAFGDMKLLSARAEGLAISYRTPFQRMPEANDAQKYRAAQLGRIAPKNLPYGLDIWAPNKVMNLEWDDEGNIELVSLRRGPWELELITLVKSVETQLPAVARSPI
jgi:hypothetical protein